MVSFSSSVKSSVISLISVCGQCVAWPLWPSPQGPSMMNVALRDAPRPQKQRPEKCKSVRLCPLDRVCKALEAPLSSTPRSHLPELNTGQRNCIYRWPGWTQANTRLALALVRASDLIQMGTLTARRGAMAGTSREKSQRVKDRHFRAVVLKVGLPSPQQGT